MNSLNCIYVIIIWSTCWNYKQEKFSLEVLQTCTSPNNEFDYGSLQSFLFPIIDFIMGQVSMFSHGSISLLNILMRRNYVPLIEAIVIVIIKDNRVTIYEIP